MKTTSSWFNQDYFRWLCSLISLQGAISPKTQTLCRDLHETFFTWSVPNDDNRSEEGIQLRLAYAEEVPNADYSPDGNATVLEMLVALAIEMDGILGTLDDERRVNVWFNQLILNLGLIGYDEQTDSPSECVKIRYHNSKLVNGFLNRTYSETGEGGLFPLKRPTEDQRNVEIWYQMMAYLNEKQV